MELSAGTTLTRKLVVTPGTDAVGILDGVSAP